VRRENAALIISGIALLLSAVTTYLNFDAWMSKSPDLEIRWLYNRAPVLTATGIYFTARYEILNNSTNDVVVSEIHSLGVFPVGDVRTDGVQSSIRINGAKWTGETVTVASKQRIFVEFDVARKSRNPMWFETVGRKAAPVVVAEKDDPRDFVYPETIDDEISLVLLEQAWRTNRYFDGSANNDAEGELRAGFQEINGVWCDPVLIRYPAVCVDLHVEEVGGYSVSIQPLAAGYYPAIGPYFGR